MNLKSEKKGGGVSGLWEEDGDFSRLIAPKHIDLGTLGKGITNTLINKSGATTTVGYVYRIDPDNNNSFDYGSDGEDVQACVAIEVIANDQATRMHIGAGIVDVQVIGTVVIGDYLYFSTVPGQAKGNSGRITGAFGQAVEARTGAGLVKTLIFLHPPEIVRDDTESGRNNIILPLTGTIEAGWTRVAGDETWNSVLDIGTGGEFDDERVYGHSVCRVGDKWVIAYTGHSGVAGAGIGIAVADIDWSGTAPTLFTRGADNPIIEPSGTGYRQDQVAWCSLIVDEEANNLVLYFLGQKGAVEEFGYAFCSLDDDYEQSANWTVSASGIFTPKSGTGSNGVAYKLGKTYILMYRWPTDASIYMATSASPDSGFVEFGTALITPGSGGAWDDVSIAYPSFFYESGIMYSFYVGDNGGGSKIGIAATSVDDFYSGWRKWNRNPIIPLGLTDDWNDAITLKSNVIRFGTKFLLFINGRNNTDGQDRIGIYELAL